MKIRTIAVTTALMLTSSLAFAQTSVDPGATVPQLPATAVPGDGAGVRTVDPAGTIQSDKTIGEAPARPATPGVVPGARDKSRVGGQGVHDRPAGN